MSEKIHVISARDRVVGLIAEKAIHLAHHDKRIAIPIQHVNWSDERQWCSAVHDYLSTGAPPNGDCPMHQGGVCRLVGDRPCLFDEPESSRGWQWARQWVRHTTPEGEEVLMPREALIK